MRPIAMTCLGVVVSAVAVCARDKPLPPHEALLAEDFVAQCEPVETPKAVVTRVPADHPAFSGAVRVENRQRMAHFWEFQRMAPVPTAMAKGDVLLLRFYARGGAPGNEHGEADVQAYFQKNSPNYAKDLSVHLTAGDSWRRFDYPFKVRNPLAAGAGALAFGFGFNEQWVEIGGVQLLRFAAGTHVRDLPVTPISYPGRGLDARWRREAAARIETHRKGDLVVAVADEAGHPLEGADVRVEMTRHAFHFSSVISVPALMAGDETARIYRQHVAELFNASGPENALKWPAWAGSWGAGWTKQRTLKALRRLKDRGLHVRGHVMIWPSSKHLPVDIRALVGTDAQDRIPELCLAHIREVSAATADCVDEWDVMNEPRTNHELMDLFGREIMVDWFKAAREALPDVPLYINDFGVLNGGGPGSRVHDTYRDNIQFLLDHGAPVTGIGLQSHIGSTLRSPAKVYATLDDMASFGLDLRITEFDIDITDEEAQADYTRDFMTLVFSHPRVVGFQMWGFWEGRHWKPAGAMFRRNWEPKPNAAAYRKLVFADWWTDETGRSGADGAFRCRGFLGEHKVTVSYRGRTVTNAVTLARDGTALRVQLPTGQQRSGNSPRRGEGLPVFRIDEMERSR